MPNENKSPRLFGRRIASALSPRLPNLSKRAPPPWITVEDVDEEGDNGDNGRSGEGALVAFRRRVSSSVSASMRVKKSKSAAATPAAPRKTRTKSVSFEVSLLSV